MCHVYIKFVPSTYTDILIYYLIRDMYVRTYVHTVCMCPCSCIQEQIEDMKKKEERLEKVLAETQMENRKLQEPLQHVSPLRP